jgi:hypothetical protein
MQEAGNRVASIFRLRVCLFGASELGHERPLSGS